MVRALGLFQAMFYTAKRYKIDWWGSCITPLFYTLPALMIIMYNKFNNSLFSHSNISDVNTYLKYLIIGIAYWGYVEVLWSVVFTLRGYMRTGQFEDIFISPISGFENILGWAMFGIIRVSIESLPLILISLIINAWNISSLSFMMMVVVLILSMVASFGLVFIIFGISLVIKEGDQIASLVGNSAPFICGLLILITFLPKGIQYISYIFPFTWGLDLIRNLVVGSSCIVGFKQEIILLFIFSVLYIVIGTNVYKLLEKKCRVKGVQGF